MTRAKPPPPAPPTLDAPPATAPWDERHRREAWTRIFELTAAALRASTKPLGKTDALDPDLLVHDEVTFREWGLRFHGFDDARKDREVRRVRDLAEGRKVRLLGYRVGLNFYTTGQRAEAIAYAASAGYVAQRSARIRRAPR